MNVKFWIPIILFLLIIALIVEVVPYPLAEAFIFLFVLLFLPYSIYKRRRYSKGEILFLLSQSRGWRILGTIISIIFPLIALFFLIVGIKSIYKGSVRSLYEWLMLLGAIVLFGSVPFLNTGKLILLNNALVAPGIAISWQKIRDWKWFETRNKRVYALVIYINLLGIKIPFTIRGFSPDINTRKEMDKIFGEKIGMTLPKK
jgi:hypothetical protein